MHTEPTNERRSTFRRRIALAMGVAAVLSAPLLAQHDWQPPLSETKVTMCDLDAEGGPLIVTEEQSSAARQVRMGTASFILSDCRP